MAARKECTDYYAPRTDSNIASGPALRRRDVGGQLAPVPAGRDRAGATDGDTATRRDHRAVGYAPARRDHRAVGYEHPAATPTADSDPGGELRSIVPDGVHTTATTGLRLWRHPLSKLRSVTTGPAQLRHGWGWDRLRILIDKQVHNGRDRCRKETPLATTCGMAPWLHVPLPLCNHRRRVGRER